MKDFLIKNSLVDCKVLHQHNSSYSSLKKKYNTSPSGICGYVACAVATYLNDMIPSTIMDINEFIDICINLNNDKVILSYVEEVMSFIQNNRINNITKNYEKYKPSTGWANNWLQGWVSNYEISDYMKSLKKSNIYFYRFNQIRDIKTIQSDADRGDPIGFFELDRLKEEYDMNLYEKNKDFNFIQSPDGSLLSLNEWIVIHNNNSKPKPKIFIIDCVGHYTAGANITIKVNNEFQNKLILFDSLWSQDDFLILELEDQFSIENFFYKPRYESISKEIYNNVFTNI